MKKSSAKITLRILLCLTIVFAAVSAIALITVPGPNPDLIDVFNNANGFRSDPTNPVRVAKGPPPVHAGHVTVLKLFGTSGPGGNLGGTTQTFSSANGALFRIDMFNPDDASEPHRIIDIPISGEIHTGPRTPRDKSQDFDTEMVQLQGAIFGDPDFDILRVRVGEDFGLPSPGHTTLTRRPDGNFNVDSFFDITYTIDFVGAPGGVYDGASGSETGTTHLSLGGPVPEPSIFALTIFGLLSLLGRGLQCK